MAETDATFAEMDFVIASTGGSTAAILFARSK